MTDREAFYKKLKVQLEDTSSFPSKYLYKFIVPSDGNQVKEVEALFDTGGPVISTKKSRTGKYSSVSVELTVSSADEVISYYKKAESIKGIISL